MSKHICVVEDRDALRSALVDWLRKAGFMASGFVNGLEVIEVLDQADFDLVLSDVDMPEMNGLELSQCILDRGLCLPVILMSGTRTLRDDEWGVGVSAFLKKPFTPAELMSHMTEAFSSVAN